jgi:class 3 adenylate cyclase
MVEKFIGDAVIAVWGAPTATEDAAERAVRAAFTLADQALDISMLKDGWLKKIVAELQRGTW